jgi:hypothetical protein
MALSVPSGMSRFPWTWTEGEPAGSGISQVVGASFDAHYLKTGFSEFS